MTKCSFLSGDSSCNTAGTMHRWYLFSFRQPLQKLGNLTDSTDCYTEQTLLTLTFSIFFLNATKCYDFTVFPVSVPDIYPLLSSNQCRLKYSSLSVNKFNLLLCLHGESDK